jgi:hypothetical protein
MTTTYPPSPPRFQDMIAECDQLLYWLCNSEEAHTLNLPDSIRSRFGEIITVPYCVDHLCKNDDTFNQCYTGHYVRGHKTFAMMDILSSFMMSILMHKYH